MLVLRICFEHTDNIHLLDSGLKKYKSKTIQGHCQKICDSVNIVVRTSNVNVPFVDSDITQLCCVTCLTTHKINSLERQDQECYYLNMEGISGTVFNLPTSKTNW